MGSYVHKEGKMTEQTNLVAPHATQKEWVDLDHIEIGNLWSEYREVYSFAMELQKRLKERNA
jgi:hypothetical protein